MKSTKRTDGNEYMIFEITKLDEFYDNFGKILQNRNFQRAVLLTEQLANFL